MIPSIDICTRLMEEYGMPEHIKAHSFAVARIARVLARELRMTGMDISLEKVTAGALMHDIGKKEALDRSGDHSEIGRKICLENGLHEIADIVAEHVRLKEGDSNSLLSEKEIVYYADKRVNHDKVVNLSDRRDYILERYGMNKAELRDRISENFDFCRRIEKRIFNRLSFQPEDLAHLEKEEEICGWSKP